MPLPRAVVLIEALPRRALFPDCVPAEAAVLNESCAQLSAALPVQVSNPELDSMLNDDMPMAAAPVRRLFVLLVPLLSV